MYGNKGNAPVLQLWLFLAIFLRDRIWRQCIVAAISRREKVGTFLPAYGGDLWQQAIASGKGCLVCKLSDNGFAYWLVLMNSRKEGTTS